MHATRSLDDIAYFIFGERPMNEKLRGQGAMRKNDRIQSDFDDWRWQVRVKSFEYSYLENMVNVKGGCLPVIFNAAVHTYMSFL
jgi:hypothetical protein